MDIDKYKKIFIQEAGNYLHELDATLILVEKDLLNRDLWSEIHGRIHSIKGMARALSLDTVSGLCHSMEAWCKEFQTGAIEPTVDSVQLMMDSTELLKELVTEISDSGSHADAQQLNRITALLAKSPEELASEKQTGTRPVSPPSKIDRIRVEYSLIEELLARS